MKYSLVPSDYLGMQRYVTCTTQEDYLLYELQQYVDASRASRT